MSIFPHQKVTLKSPWNPRRTSAEAAPQAMDPLIWQSPGPLLGSMAMWLWYGHQRWGESKHYIYILYIYYYILYFLKKNIWPYDNGLTLCYHWSYRTEANLPSPVHFFHLESSLSIPGRPTPGHLLLSRGQLGISYSTLPKFLQHSIEKHEWGHH